MFAMADGILPFVTLAVFPEVISGVVTGFALVVVLFFDGQVEQYRVPMTMVFEIEEMLKNAQIQ